MKITWYEDVEPSVPVIFAEEYCTASTRHNDTVYAVTLLDVTDGWFYVQVDWVGKYWKLSVLSMLGFY